MRRAIARHAVLPDIPAGYPLDERRAWASLVVPEATTNLFTNPSFELGTAGWTASGGVLLVTEGGNEIVTEGGDNLVAGSEATLTQSATQQVRGAYCAELTLGVGDTDASITGGGFTPTITAQYAFSAHVRRPGGGAIRASDVRLIANGQSLVPTLLEYVGNGWWRIGVVFVATTTDALGVLVLGVAGDTWHIDACQVEAKGYHTTYCDGDELGLLPFESPAPFRWNGSPHASTATRSATTRAGGRVRNLSAYGLTVVTVVGLGMLPVANVATPLGNAPGSLYQTTEEEARTFTLGGRFQAADPGRLARYRGALRADLNAARTGVPQPVRLILQMSEDDRAIGDQVYADCSYAGGLEGQQTGLYAEDVSIQFEQWQPSLASVASRGAALTGSTGEGTINNSLIERLESGRYRLPSPVGGGTPTALLYARDGTLYAGFSAAGTYGWIARWNGSSWSAMGTGLNGQPDTIVEGVDGTIYVGGNFTSAGGVANTTYAARWNGSAWLAMGTGLNGRCRAMCVLRSGLVAAVGDFTTADGLSSVRFGAYTPGADGWSGGSAPFSTGLNATGRALVADYSGNNTFYVGGDFTTADGVTVNRVARFNGTTFTSLGGGTASSVNALVIGPDTYLYAGGAFTAIGGVSANRVARWNGSQWQPLGDGAGGTVNTLAFDLSGILWIGGNTITSTGVQVLRWNGSAYLLIDLLAGNATVTAIAVARDGRIGIGGPDSSAQSTEQVAPAGLTAETPYIVRLRNTSASLNSGAGFRVIASDRGEYSASYGAGAGETLTVRGDDGPTISSSNIGDRVPGVRDGSSVQALRVAPSGDVMRVLVSANDTFDAALYYYPRLLSLDDTVPGGL